MGGHPKLDLRIVRRALYQPGSDDFAEIVVPRTGYLAVDGQGDPNSSPAYAAAVGALYATGYAVKFPLRDRTGTDWVVGPLEGLWSSPDPAAFTARDKSAWDWTMLIPLPDEVTTADVAAAVEQAARKKPELPVRDVGRRVLDEGRSLQILHLGPYDDEGPTLARLHREVMPARGLTWNGPHHEIYLSDPRRTVPAKLRTVLRQPVRPA